MNRAETLHAARYNIKDRRKKYSWPKRIGGIMSKIKFSLEILHICCTSIATEHARRQKNITLPEAGPSLRVMSVH